jgi:hypothetical protein
LPNNRRQRRTCYALCHILYPESAAHTSISRMDSNSTSYRVVREVVRDPNPTLCVRERENPARFRNRGGRRTHDGRGHHHQTPHPKPQTQARVVPTLFRCRAHDLLGIRPAPEVGGDAWEPIPRPFIPATNPNPQPRRGGSPYSRAMPRALGGRRGVGVSHERGTPVHPTRVRNRGGRRTDEARSLTPLGPP